MKCPVCKEIKPEPQEYKEVNGKQIPKPCRECFAKHKAAYDDASEADKKKGRF